MAKAKSTAKSEPEVISDILKVSTGTVSFCVLGKSPLILNRMSEKAKHELLFPKGRKSTIEKATSMKHNPVDEFRASAYTLKDEDAPTFLAILSTSFKGAIRSAALDLPGPKKSQVGRLTFLEGDYVSIYGLPKLFMSITRSADMNRTPDVRTRAALPQWAARVDVTYVEPLIRAQAVANLLAAAGLTVGVGDWRPEKGAGSNGQFVLVGPDDPTFLSIIRNGGRAAQIEALQHPVPYDAESEELLTWFDDEKAKRSLKGVA